MCALLRKGITTEVLEGQTDPKGGWVSYAYSKRTPIPQLIHRKKGRVPVRFITALYPEKRGSVELVEEDKIDELRLEIDSDGQRWDALLHPDRFEIKKT